MFSVVVAGATTICSAGAVGSGGANNTDAKFRGRCSTDAVLTVAVSATVAQ